MSRGFRALLGFVAPLLVLVPLTLWMGRLYENDLLLEEREDIAHIVDLHANALQRAVDRLHYELDALKAFVADETREGRAIDAGKFDTFARGLHAGTKWIRAFQIVTDGVITHTYPIESNEAILRYDLKADPRPVIDGDVVRARENQRATVTGPIELVQGGLGIVVRAPLTGPKESPSRLVAIALNTDPLLIEGGIMPERDHGIRFAVRHGPSREVFFGQPTVFGGTPITRRVSLPEGTWEISAVPAQGWMASVHDPLRRFYMMGAIIVLLICLLTFSIVQRQTALAEAVRKRTVELRDELAARQHAEGELRREHELLVAVTEGTLDTVFVKDLHGRYQMINSAGALFFRKPVEEVLHRHDTELFLPEIAAAIAAQDRLVMESGQVHTFEEQFDPTDVTRTYLTTKAPWRDEQGEVAGVIGISHDFSDRHRTEMERARLLDEAEAARRSLLGILEDEKRIESALRTSETRFRTLAEDAPVGIFETGADGNCTYVNGRWSALTGLTADQAMGTGWNNALHPEDHERVSVAWQESVLFGREFALEYRFRTPSGSVNWVAGRSIALRNEKGMVTGYLGTVGDITELKLAGEAIEQSRRRLERAQAISHVGNWEFDLHDGRARWSDELYRICGLEPQSFPVTYPRLRTMLHPDDRAIHDAYNKRVLASRPGTSVDPLNYRIIRPDGQQIHVRMESEIVFDTEGRPSHAYGTAQDITERVEAESEIRQLAEELEQRVQERTAQLQAANKGLEAFSYSVSHDLRAPLRAISGFAQIIAQRHRSALNDEGQRYFDHIVAASERMFRLIDDLLDYARLGRKSILLEPVPLSDVLAAVTSDLASRVQEAGGQLTVAADLPVVRGDWTLLRQIFTNLVGNALTYRRKDIPVQVSVHWDTIPNNVVVHVTDNGIGIAREFHEKIFDVFQRLHSEEEFPGTGIGLAVVARAVNLLGGEIWVESKAGDGSTFSVRLPQTQTRDS